MLKLAQKIKTVAHAAMAVVGFSIISTGTAYAGNPSGQRAILEQIQAHELRDIEVGVQILGLIEELAAVKNNEVQDLMLLLQDDLLAYHAKGMVSGSLSSQMTTLPLGTTDSALNVMVAFKTFDGARAQLEELHNEANDYAYAIEILAFFAD